MDWSLLGPAVYGIFQARILQWVAISFSRRSSQPRNWTRVSSIVGRRFTIWAIQGSPMAGQCWESTGCTASAIWISLSPFSSIWPHWESDLSRSQHSPGNCGQRMLSGIPMNKECCLPPSSTRIKPLATVANHQGQCVPWGIKDTEKQEVFCA